MALHRAHREVGDGLVGDAHRVADLLGQGAQSAAQDQPHPGLHADEFSDNSGGFVVGLQGEGLWDGLWLHGTPFFLS